jgi:hypothetical protein
MNNPNKYGYIFGYFTSICDGCLTGSVLKLINDFYERDVESFGALLILGSDYTNNDLINLKMSLRIAYEVDIQSPQLSEYANSINSEFGEGTLNNTVIFADSSGRILRVFHNSCGCWNSFSSFMNEFPSLVIKENK